jgi:AraC-like DNA-binding protein
MSETYQHRVGVLVELPDLLRALGVDPERTITDAGIRPELLEDTESKLSFTKFGRLMRVCAARTGCDHIGLLLGLRARTHHLGEVGSLMRHAPTLGQAIQDLCTNQERYIRGAVAYLTVQNGIALWGYALQQAHVEGIEIISDAATAVGFSMIRELSGASPDTILNLRKSPADFSPYKKLLGLVPRFNSEQTAVLFPVSLLDAPVLNAEREKRRTAEDRVARYWAVAKPSIADRVARSLTARVLFGKTSIEELADESQMHPRTLRRRLQKEGTNFRDLLAEARFAAAEQLLMGTQMRATEIAEVLGYSDLPAFSVAFTRRVGVAPSEWRRQLASAMPI